MGGGGLVGRMDGWAPPVERGGRAQRSQGGLRVSDQQEHAPATKRPVLEMAPWDKPSVLRLGGPRSGRSADRGSPTRRNATTIIVSGCPAASFNYFRCRRRYASQPKPTMPIGASARLLASGTGSPRAIRMVPVVLPDMPPRVPPAAPTKSIR